MFTSSSWLLGTTRVTWMALFVRKSRVASMDKVPGEQVRVLSLLA